MRFKDNLGREWFCRVDWGAMRRSEAAGVDLSMVEVYMADFHRGSIKLIDALWAVLSPAAKAAEVTKEQFEQAMGGEAMILGREALLAGCKDFFPPSRAELITQADREISAEIRGLLKPLPKPSTVSPEKSE
jgi:hypothetical protein